MELLAPAGSIEALKYAINCGADAVYLGLGEHNARVKSNDFNQDNLSEWVDYCHLYGVKVYVTLNTLIKDEELARIDELIKIIDKSNADAIIVTDIAAILIAQRVAPSLNIHISTQAGAHNTLSAKFYKNLGAKRVVLARETDDFDIADIKRNVDIEIESFIHGAICVSMSGACLLSSVSGGLSGNRGRCMQPCRKLYTAFDDANNYIKSGYLLSAADLAGDIDKPVDSLKIEGRLKRPEYVGVVTDYYRRMIEGKRADINELKKIYNRGNFINKYQSCKDLIYPYTPNHIGIKIGNVIKVAEVKGYYFAEIKSNHTITKGDGLKILRNNIECGGSDVTSVKRKGDNYIVPVSAGVKAGDEVRLTTDICQINAVKNKVKKISVSFDFAICSDSAVLIAKYKDIAVSTTLNDITIGSIEDSQIATQLNKTKDTPFEIINIVIDNRGGKLPKSAINAMRREALNKLQESIIKAYKREQASGEVITTNTNKSYKKGKRLFEIQSAKQLEELSLEDTIIINPINLNIKNIEAFINIRKDVYIKMPRLNKNDEYSEVLTYAKANNIGILADNPYAVQYARDNNIKYIAGIGLNIYNKHAFDYYSDADYILLSPEITNTQLLERGGVLFALGYLPLMTLAHCPLSVVYDNHNCSCVGKIIYYNNGEYSFAVVPTVNKLCQYTLYNSVIHNLLSKIENLGYNMYINMLGFESVNLLYNTKGTLGHYQKNIK